MLEIESEHHVQLVFLACKNADGKAEHQARETPH
jgi:hypothetical protein